MGLLLIPGDYKKKKITTLFCINVFITSTRLVCQQNVNMNFKLGEFSANFDRSTQNLIRKVEK